MANVISILNLKGGIGKTTTTVNLAAAMNRNGLRVLVIDTDPQANTSKALGLVTEEGYTSLDDAYRASLEGKPAMLPIQHRQGGIDVVLSSIQLSTVEMSLNTAIRKDERLERLLAPVRSEYDYILIDCPPSLNIFVINALMASNCVIVPVESQALALQGLEDTIGLIKQVQAFKSELHILGLLLTKYDARTTLSRKVEEMLRDSYGEFVFDTNIRYNITAAESPLYGRHLLEYAPNSKSAVDYCALCSEVIKRIYN